MPDGLSWGSQSDAHGDPRSLQMKLDRVLCS